MLFRLNELGWPALDSEDEYPVLTSPANASDDPEYSGDCSVPPGCTTNNKREQCLQQTSSSDSHVSETTAASNFFLPTIQPNATLSPSVDSAMLSVTSDGLLQERTRIFATEGVQSCFPFSSCSLNIPQPTLPVSSTSSPSSCGSLGFSQLKLATQSQRKRALHDSVAHILTVSRSTRFEKHLPTFCYAEGGAGIPPPEAVHCQVSQRKKLRLDLWP